MKHLRAFFLISSLCGTTLSVCAQDEIKWEIRPQTDAGFIEYDLNTGVGSTTNGVIITYSNIVLTADSVVADPNTGDVQAQGHVSIKSRGAVWNGERIRYNFKTQQMVSDTFKLGQNPFFIAGQGLKANQTNQTYSATNVIVTTDDYADPAYKIRARRLTIVPGKYFEAEGATVRIGDVPVFYFPYYRRSIGYRVNHFDFTPGYRSTYGPYLLSTYNWYWQEKIDGAIHMDYRQLRGLAGGPDLAYHFGNLGDGKIEYYYAHDEDAGHDFQTNAISKERQRIAFSHQTTLRTNLTVKAVANYQTDALVDHDFFENEYRHNVQPKSFVEVNQLWPNFSLDILAQPQVNDFQETVERLPDIKLTALRQQLFDTPLYYEGENSVGYFHRAFVDNSTNYSAARADSFHQILLPQTYFGWLNFTPRAGGRFTYYGEADGPGATNWNEEARGVFNTGAEVTFKASQVWAGAENKALDLHGLRHIFEPLVNYAFVPRPNVLPRELPQFDYELQSLRTLPIDFPQYNDIDSIDSQNVLRFGMRNRLQTKRDGVIDDLLAWTLFTDWRIKPRDDQKSFAPLTSTLEFKPRTWLTWQSDTRYNLNARRLIEADNRIFIEPNSTWSLALGHRFLDSDPSVGLGEGHNLFTTSMYYRMNENWAARISHHFEARDGTLEEQYYTLYRDLRSWTAALTVRLRDNRGAPDDFTIAATFSLKAFPRFGLDSDRDKPSLLVGY